MIQLFIKSARTLKNEGVGMFFKKARNYARKRYIRIREKILKMMPVDKRGFPSPESANKYDIIFFPVINWDFRFQRPQQIASRLAMEDHRVFYFSMELTKYPSYTHRKIAHNVYEITLPFRENVSLYETDILKNADTVYSAIRELFTDFKIKESASIVEFPYWWPVVKRLQAEFNTKVVFDCLDDYVGFDNIRQDVAALEQEMLKSADCCIATSKNLFEKCRSAAPRCVIVRNAADFEHFSRLPETGVLAHCGKPVIGYYGAIAEWFDTETVAYAAAQRPDWTFVLIGHMFGSDSALLRQYKNIILAGEKPYAKLPQYLYWFDVCIIPFKLNELIMSTNPVKFYEFISSGKPVVAPHLPELEQFSDIAYLASGKEEFLRKIEIALAEKDESLKAKRIAAAKTNSWESRVADFKKCIREAFVPVSIVIVTYNNLDKTKLCLESIYAKTAYPDFEIIVVDNASSDGTQAWLTEFASMRDNIKLVLNKDNLGFAAANNQGIKLSRGGYVILLNNDTVVTRGWINGLVRPFVKDTSAGMAGPVTNFIGNEAKIDVDYDDLSRMDYFAERYTRENKGKWFEIRVLAMFCVVIPRGTLDRVGLLDEQFRVGMFEDDDYAMRVRKEGLKVLCLEDVFIHHFGGAAFGKLQSAEYQKIFNENKEKFEKKWGPWIPHKYR